jgi:hypothetical protein
MSTPILCLIAGLIAIAVDRAYRFWKRPEPTVPTHARLLARPGVTLHLVNEDGVVRAKVILSQITVDSERGTSVQFEDYRKYMQARTYGSGF